MATINEQCPPLRWSWTERDRKLIPVRGILNDHLISQDLKDDTNRKDWLWKIVYMLVRSLTDCFSSVCFVYCDSCLPVSCLCSCGPMRMRISELSEQDQDYLGRPVLLHTLTRPQLPTETCDGATSEIWQELTHNNTSQSVSQSQPPASVPTPDWPPATLALFRPPMKGLKELWPWFLNIFVHSWGRLLQFWSSGRMSSENK